MQTPVCFHKALLYLLPTLCTSDDTLTCIFTTLHLLQLSLAEWLLRLVVLFFLFHNHSDLKMLCRKYSEKSQISKREERGK